MEGGERANLCVLLRGEAWRVTVLCNEAEWRGGRYSISLVDLITKDNRYLMRDEL